MKSLGLIATKHHHWSWCVLLLCVLGFQLPTTLAQESADAKSESEPFQDPAWKFVIRKPAENWQTVDFDDSDWKEGFGGFGVRSTPGSRVGTTWRSNDIWMRRTIELQSIPAKPALLIHHDENAQVYINGKRVGTFDGYVTEYQVVPLSGDAVSALKIGDNTMAVHCHQTGGGQFIDVHLVDANNVPKLPPAKRPEKPFVSELITTWGSEVTAENAWTEYPRPALRREQWTNLNGNWNYQITKNDVTERPSEWAGEILVPFAIESKLSGVQKLLHPDEALWYERTIEGTPAEGQRRLLHFEAVDYRCSVWVNDTKVGEHVGGNIPFSLDITDALKDGENTLVVRVEDTTGGYQLRGKQTTEPEGIWYTQVSGIWQTVWTEDVPANYLGELKIATDAKSGSINLGAEVKGIDTENVSLVVKVRDGDKVVAEAKGAIDQVEIAIEDAKLWSPDSPHLYDLEVTLIGEDGQALDQVQSYAGIRTVGKVKDSNGHWRMTLNGEPIFHWGPLDQGWWPDGLLTPPSDEAMLFDVEYLKAAGFNMIRKHIKVEPRRFYYHCDRLGMLVWQDQVSGGQSPRWTRLDPNPTDADWDPKAHMQYMAELDEMIDLLENHPSIVVWVPFNEAWGQHSTIEVGKWTVERDPTRLVNVASGGNFWPVGDIVDQHAYPHPDFPFDEERDQNFIMVVGEFGGHGYPVRGHLWDANRRNWGYGGLPENESEYRERYVESLRRLVELQKKGIAGAVYTQTTDVEGEINGLMTYDRKVIKIQSDVLSKLHEQLFDE